MNFLSSSNIEQGGISRLVHKSMKRVRVGGAQMDLTKIAEGAAPVNADRDKELKRKTDLCYRLRKLANLDRVRLVEDKHSNGINTNLFGYLRLCGKEPEQFVKECIANLHPFMIERRKDQEYDDTVVCVLDKYYSISIYIKEDFKKMEEVIVSFHESHIKGIGSLNFSKKRNERVPVIISNIVSQIENSDLYTVAVRVQRGVLVVPITLSARKVGDVYYVVYSDIERELVGLCNSYIEDVYSAAEELDMNSIILFSNLQQLSFPSHGKDNFSALSLLVDSFYAQSDKVSRAAADFALVTYTRQLLLDERQKAELIETLNERFLVKSRKGLEEVLSRIIANLDTIVDM